MSSGGINILRYWCLHLKRNVCSYNCIRLFLCCLDVEKNVNVAVLPQIALSLGSVQVTAWHQNFSEILTPGPNLPNPQANNLSNSLISGRLMPKFHAASSRTLLTKQTSFVAVAVSCFVIEVFTAEFFQSCLRSGTYFFLSILPLLRPSIAFCKPHVTIIWLFTSIWTRVMTWIGQRMMLRTTNCKHRQAHTHYRRKSARSLVQLCRVVAAAI